MELLKIDSPDVEKAAVAYANSRYTSGWLWIDGKTSTGCNVLNRKVGSPSFINIVVLPNECERLFFSLCGYSSKEI